jgi:hypothetical protein
MSEAFVEDGLDLMGIVEQLPEEQYFGAAGMSVSGLKKFHTSPAHYQTSIHMPDEPTEAMLFGRYFHQAVRERENFEKLFTCVPEGMRRDERMKAYQDFKAENQGKTILTSNQYEQLACMIDTVDHNSEVLALLQGGRKEVSMFAIHPIAKVLVKGRADQITVSHEIPDFKTCESAAPLDFERDTYKYKYHWQAAFYLDLYRAITGEDATMFPHIAIEKKPVWNKKRGCKEHPIAIYNLDDGALDKGREEYLEVLFRYAECLKTDEWPCYPAGVQPMSLPHWAF